MSAEQFEPDAANCRLMARGSVRGTSIEAYGSAKFVATYTAAAAVGAAIDSAVQQNATFNDCMQARGWRVVDGSTPVPEASLYTPVAITTQTIPAATVEQPVPVLAQASAPSDAGMRPRQDFGVRAHLLTPATAETMGLKAAYGLVVSSVSATGAAAAAGIRPGDVILTFRNIPIVSAAQMQQLLTQVTPGQPVTALLCRGGQELPTVMQF